MSSNFDNPHLRDACASGSKKAEENLYFSSEGIGEYCGLTSPHSLSPRSSDPTFPSGSGYNGSRGRFEECPQVRNSHRATIAARLDPRHKPDSNDHTSNQSNYNGRDIRESRERNHDKRTHDTARPFNPSTLEIYRDTNRSRDRNEHIRNNERKYGKMPTNATNPSRDARRIDEDHKRFHSEHAQSTVSAQPRPKPRPQRHSTGEKQHAIITEQPISQARTINNLRTPGKGQTLTTRQQVVQPTPNLTGTMDSNMNKVKGTAQPVSRPPHIRIDSRHVASEQQTPPRSPRIRQLQQEERSARNPMLSESPRPHSLDVPDTKPKIQRTSSAPELRRPSCEELLFADGKQTSISTGNKISVEQSQKDKGSKLNTHVQGSRSKSLPTVIPRSSKRIYSTDANPLRYFAYLGKRFQFRERLLSAHNVLSSGPVILTSTSVISPEVSNNFRNQLEEQERNEMPKYQSACQDFIDCCTCMCCVKALFYHCTKDDDSEGELSEHPCSCLKPGADCILRWGILGMLTTCMPCLLCYLPIQGCKRAIKHCRNKDIT